MNNKIKFLRGTSGEYTVAKKDNDTFYFTTDNGKLYIGDKEVSGADVTIDDTLSDTSENPIQNKIVKQAIDNKADKTVATTLADGLMSAEDKSKLDSANDTYALKSKYGNTTINVGRKTGTAIGSFSNAEGIETTASGEGSHAEGRETTASGKYSHTEGVNTVAIGHGSHAEGSNIIKVDSNGNIMFGGGRDVIIDDTTTINVKSSQAYGINSHAEGCSTLAYGINSHTEGYATVAYSNESHAEGSGSKAIGAYSHAEGSMTNASGACSHTGGSYTEALHNYEVAYGKFNKSNDDTLFSIGDGTGNNARHNAFEITATGGKLHDKDIATTEQITTHTDNSVIHVTATDKSNWNGYATEINQNKTDISAAKTDIQNLQNQDATVRTQISELKQDKVDKDEIINAGIKKFSYVPLFGGEFTVTTVDEEGYISPHSRASVQGRISKHYTYRITVNGEMYELPCDLYGFTKEKDGYITSGKVVEYLGNLSLYTEDTSGLTHDIRNVPFCIISDLDAHNSIDVFTQFPITASILVEQIQKDQIVLPKSLIWGDDYCPFEFKRNDGTFNGLSIGVNSLKNTRGTFAIGSHNEVSGDFSVAIGVGNKATGRNSTATGSLVKSSGDYAFAEGYGTTASGHRSHAAGYKTTASGGSSHAEGQACIANGPLSHSGGNLSEASGRASFAHGNFVKAICPSQFVVGYGNDPQEDSIFEIGNGLDVNGQSANTGNTEPATRQNAFRVTQSGVAVVKTGLQIGNTIINEEQLQKIIALIN